MLLLLLQSLCVPSENVQRVSIAKIDKETENEKVWKNDVSNRLDMYYE